MRPQRKSSQTEIVQARHKQTANSVSRWSRPIILAIIWVRMHGCACVPFLLESLGVLSGKGLVAERKFGLTFEYTQNFRRFLRIRST